MLARIPSLGERQNFFGHGLDKEKIVDFSEVEKWEDLPTKHLYVLCGKLGNVKTGVGIIQGKLEVKVQVTKVIKKLFDDQGRRLSEGIFKESIPGRGYVYNFNHPVFENVDQYQKRLDCLNRHLGIVTNMTAQRFKDEAERLLDLIGKDKSISKITNGVCLPLILPQITASNPDVALSHYLLALANSYTEAYPEREFIDYRGKVHYFPDISRDTHYQNLYHRLQNEPLVALYFPQALHHFPSSSSKFQMAELPKEFVLSGFETLVAMITYPDILAEYGTGMSGFSLGSVTPEDQSKNGYILTINRNILVFCHNNSPVSDDNFSDSLLFVGAESKL